MWHCLQVLHNAGGCCSPLLEFFSWGREGGRPGPRCAAEPASPSPMDSLHLLYTHSFHGAFLLDQSIPLLKEGQLLTQLNPAMKGPERGRGLLRAFTMGGAELGLEPQHMVGP